MAVKFVLDTSAFSALNRGDARLEPYFASNDGVVVPVVVIGELRGGFALGNRRQINDRLLKRFLDAPRVSTVGITDETANVYADIFRRLRETGRPIGINDMWIAAVAIEHDLPLLTLDSDFGRIAGLEILPL